jgi:DNA-binding response OmpR family regulator
VDHSRREAILCVDDEPEVLTALRRTLRREPYDVVTATDASLALECLERLPIEVVIADERMPEMCGTQLLRGIRKRWPRMGLVILTGYPGEFRDGPGPAGGDRPAALQTLGMRCAQAHDPAASRRRGARPSAEDEEQPPELESRRRRRLKTLMQGGDGLRQRLPLPVVLFADRDLTWSRIARRELRRRGALVTGAESVDEAFHQAALLPPDVVILDEDLNGRGDRDLVQVFRAAIPRARIVLLRADGSEIHPDVFASGASPVASDLVQGLAQGALGSRLRDLPKARQGTVLCVDDDRIPAFGRAAPARGGVPGVGLRGCRTRLERHPVAQAGRGAGGHHDARHGRTGPRGEIREKSNGRIPVVFLTALNTDEAYYEGHQHGARYMVDKTDAPQKVLDVVDYLAGDLDPGEREALKSKL